MIQKNKTQLLFDEIKPRLLSFNIESTNVEKYQEQIRSELKKINVCSFPDVFACQLALKANLETCYSWDDVNSNYVKCSFNFRIGDKKCACGHHSITTIIVRLKNTNEICMGTSCINKNEIIGPELKMFKNKLKIVYKCFKKNIKLVLKDSFEKLKKSINNKCVKCGKDCRTFKLCYHCNISAKSNKCKTCFKPCLAKYDKCYNCH